MTIIRPVQLDGNAAIVKKSHLRLVTPAAVNRTVTRKRMPKRPPNGDLRTRECLTEAEVERLMNAAKGNRWGSSGRHHDPDRLPARPAGVRIGGPVLGSGRFPHGGAARP